MLGFYMPLALLHNVRNAPGLLCQGCARSVPLLYPTPNPVTANKTIHLTHFTLLRQLTCASSVALGF